MVSEGIRSLDAVQRGAEARSDCLVRVIRKGLRAQDIEQKPWVIVYVIKTLR